MTTESRKQAALWTPANIVTFIRILCIPIFVIVVLSPWPEWFPQWVEAEAFKPIIAAGVFILISATDALDGYLARSRGEVTDLGKFMDPLADKMLVAAALLALIDLGVLPSWVALIILAREFIVSGIRMVAANAGVVIAASWWGKIKTVTQIIAVVLFLVKDSHMIGDFSAVLSDGLYLFSWAMMLIALFFTILSMLDYFVKARELLGFGADTREESKPDVACDVPAISSSDLAVEVVHLAVSHHKTVGTAESCTGGLIGATLTSVPGSSEAVEGGIISYSNEVKRTRLGVSATTLERYGAVSEETACEMADGARRALGVDIAVSVTGIAGPGGATPGKPVGTVWIGLSDGTLTCARFHTFSGDRDEVRRQTVEHALRMIRASLTGEALLAQDN